MMLARMGVAACLAGGLAPATVEAANFTRGTATAVKFGVHEISLTGDGGVANPYDTFATVTFTPPSGGANAVTVEAFYDGGDTWRARVYVSETGDWTWTSSSAADSGLDAKSGGFTAATSTLRGKLRKHPADSRAWATDDGAWFLNTSDTAYYLFNPNSADWQDFVADDWAHGITSVRANLAGCLSQAAKNHPLDGWDGIFSDGTRNQPRLASWQTQDARMEWMLENYPHLYVQLIVTPEPSNGWGNDESVWAGLTATQRVRFLRHVVARYAAWPQIFWLVTNDAFHGASFPNNNAMVSEIGAYLAANDPWKTTNLRSSGRNRDQSFYFTSAPWVSYIHLETTTALAAEQADDYPTSNKHVFNGEDWYEGEKSIANDAYFFRRLFWAWTLSGGSANYGGNWRTIDPYDTTNFTGLDDIIHLKNFFGDHALDLAGWVAADARITGPTGTKRVKAMRKTDDSAFLLYHPNASADGGSAAVSSGTASLTVTSLSAGAYALTWLRADDGAEVDAGTFTHAGGDKALAAPWAGKDVVAWLRADTGTPPPAGGTELVHYAFDESAGVIVNHGAAGPGLNLTDTGGATGRDGTGSGGYGASGFIGYGTAFDVLASGDGAYHGGGSGSSTGGGLATPGVVAQSALQGADGAFTHEAFVALTTTAGEQNILSHDGSGTRGFLFRVNAGQLSFYSGTASHAVNIPVGGAHAFAAGEWFHVAVAYTGEEGVAGNLRFYWTALGASPTAANLIGTATLAADLAGSVNNPLGVGTTTRSAFRYELRGLVDEVRVSDHAVAAGDFAFLGGGTPAPTVELTASDVWEQSSFNSGLNWSDASAPSAGSVYVVDGLDLRTPGNGSSHTFQGDALLLMDGGRLVMRTTATGVVTVNDLHADDGAISLAKTGAFTLAGEVTLLAGGLEVGSNTSGRTLEITAKLQGSGPLVVAGHDTALGNAANTHSGGTTVASGVLRVRAAGALGSGNVMIASGLTLDLDYAGTDTVHAFSLDGGSTYVLPGIWGAPGSGAANTSGQITGTGLLQVTSATP